MKKLEQENKELKELLRIAELRADLWQHAIEIAEQKLDIDIVKSMVPNNYILQKAKAKRKSTEMCKQFGYTKQAYYKQLTNSKRTMSQ